MSWDFEKQFHRLDKEEQTEQQEGAIRLNDNKTEWSLMDLPSFEPMVKVLEYGAKKYARDNWKQGFYVTKIYDSLMRHLIAFMNGEDNDPESGLPHIGHIQCNIMFLSHTLQHHKNFDDRKVESKPATKEQVKKFIEEQVRQREKINNNP